MAGSYSRPGVAVEVLVEEDQIAPVRVGLELFEIPEYRSAAPLILKEYVGHAARQISCYFPEAHHVSRASGALDLEVRSEVVMKLLQ